MKTYSWQEHLTYASILIAFLLIACPVIFFVGAWAIKALIWYAEIWAMLPWPTRF